MTKSTTAFVGLDAHKDSTDIGVAEAGRSGEVRHLGTISGDLVALGKAVRKLRSWYSDLHFVYEAGPCGYQVYRYLSGQGLDCTVVSPSLIPKRAGDRVKTDRRDCLQLARLHRAGELSAVYVPGVEHEAIRDLVRCREVPATNLARNSRPCCCAAASAMREKALGPRRICAGSPL